jgi:hypothetical protein
MHLGGAIFFTHYSMSAMELAHALGERGFEPLWAPERSRGTVQSSGYASERVLSPSPINDT